MAEKINSKPNRFENSLRRHLKNVPEEIPPTSRVMMNLDLKISHTYGGWNRYEVAVQKECEIELRSTIEEVRHPFIEEIGLFLEFGEKFGKVRVAPIDRVNRSIDAIFEVDWRAKVKADESEMKEFISKSAKSCLGGVFYKTGIPLESLRAVSDFGVELFAYSNSEAIELLKVPNELQINIALKDPDSYPSPKEVQVFYESLVQSQEENNYVVDGFLCGGGFFQVQIVCDDPVRLFAKLKSELYGVRAGSFAEAFHHIGDFIETERYELGRTWWKW